MKTALKARVEAGEQTHAVVSDIGGTLSDFRAAMGEDAEPEMQIQRIGLAGGAYDLTPNDLRIEKVSIESGIVDLKRMPDGSINMVQLFAPPQKGAIKREDEKAAAEGHPFQFLAKAVALTGFQVKFSDLTVRPGEPDHQHRRTGGLPGKCRRQVSYDL